eukprot:TRINITY_DN12632_c4_g1_i1.p2 TRINITY_DN12632_c4_g1~~TRINITY_DN12632_c4_g1_i1.p2  ORF type:complete len:417 (+),score=126.54 TRINITY_DN12632_c4_g1_i1:2726-3976(+)
MGSTCSSASVQSDADQLTAQLPSETMKIIKATVSVVAANVNKITATFYPRMFKNNPEVLAFFNQANQRSSRQPEALAHSVVAAVTHINNLKDIEGYLNHICAKHCALGVLPEHYAIVHDNFMGAVAEVLGDAVTPEIGQAWSDLVMHFAKALIQMETKLYDETTAKLDNWQARETKPFVVAKIVDECADFKSFYLKPQDGTAPPAFVPGQYLTLCLQTDEEVTAPRHYSISAGEVVDGCIRVSVRLCSAANHNGVAGVVSTWMHTKVKEGDVIDVRPPFGYYTREAGKYKQEVYITAGSGIIPAMAMMPSAVKQCDKVAHFHAEQDQSRHAFREEGAKLNLAHRRCHYDDQKSGFLSTKDVLEDLKMADFDMATNATGFLITGPLLFTKAMVTGLKEAGVDAACVRHELYGPRIDM